MKPSEKHPKVTKSRGPILVELHLLRKIKRRTKSRRPEWLPDRMYLIQMTPEE